jgi:hypothetical protein
VGGLGAAASTGGAENAVGPASGIGAGGLGAAAGLTPSTGGDAGPVGGLGAAASTGGAENAVGLVSWIGACRDGGGGTEAAVAGGRGAAGSPAAEGVDGRGSLAGGVVGRAVAGQAAAAARTGAFRGSAPRGVGAGVAGVAAAGIDGAGAPGGPPGARVPAAGPGGSVVAPRGGGRPDGRAAGAAAWGEPGRISSAIVGAAVGGRGAVDGVAGVPLELVVRGHAGMVPVGMGAGARPGTPGVAPGLAAGRPGELTVRGVAELWPESSPGDGPGVGVRIGGVLSNAGPGRGTGVRIGGPDAPGGSSSKGPGVSREGVAWADWRRSSPMSRLRISGWGRDGSMPGSQAVQSPCGGNSAPHLRHLDTGGMKGRM